MEYIKAAWYDFKNSPNRYSTTALLSLMYFIPILNYFLLGYNYRWSVDLLNGRRETLPTPILNQKTFIFGLFGFIVSMVVSAVTLFLCATVILIIILPLYFLAMVMIIEVALLRASLFNQFEAAFHLKTIWNVCKRDVKGLFCASLLPRLIVGVIQVAALTLVVLVFGVWSGLMIGPSDSGSIVFGLAMMFAMLIFCALLMVSTVVVNLISTRATAYWLACHAPEWIEEAAYLALPYQVRQSMKQQPSAAPYGAPVAPPIAPTNYGAPAPAPHVGHDVPPTTQDVLVTAQDVAPTTQDVPVTTQDVPVTAQDVAVDSMDSPAPTTPEESCASEVSTSSTEGKSCAQDSVQAERGDSNGAGQTGEDVDQQEGEALVDAGQEESEAPVDTNNSNTNSSPDNVEEQAQPKGVTIEKACEVAEEEKK